MRLEGLEQAGSVIEPPKTPTGMAEKAAPLPIDEAEAATMMRSRADSTAGVAQSPEAPPRVEPTTAMAAMQTVGAQVTDASTKPVSWAFPVFALSRSPSGSKAPDIQGQAFDRAQDDADRRASSARSADGAGVSAGILRRGRRLHARPHELHLQDQPRDGQGLITGVIRVSRESAFFDLNNLEVVTSPSPKYRTSFGFTQDEVDASLEEHGLGRLRDEVCRWYDGFTFGGESHIYNPWSLTKPLESGALRAACQRLGQLAHLKGRAPRGHPPEHAFREQMAGAP